MTNAGIKVTRKSADEYLHIKKVITEYMSGHGIKTYYTRDATWKADYGDLDVLYITNAAFDMRKFIIDHFKPVVIESNGGCMSFTITTGLIPADFQIDFVGVREHQIESEIFYRSYGDMGNIIGRITSYYGIKFGGQGLWVDYEFKSQSGKINNSEIMLTTSPSEICKFLALPYVDFTTEIEMFKWIVSSTWFCIEAFETLNAEYRRRTHKRPGYMRFMEFLDVTNIKPADTESTSIVHNRRRQDEAIMYFNKQVERQEAIDLKTLTEARQMKFNGQHFMSLGITGTDIGRKINDFKNHIGSSWYTWLDAQPDFETVGERVRQFINGT